LNNQLVALDKKIMSMWEKKLNLAREEVENLLRDSMEGFKLVCLFESSGTFLIRWSDRARSYVISIRTKVSYIHRSGLVVQSDGTLKVGEKIFADIISYIKQEGKDLSFPLEVHY
jgi:hypothetical protein